MDDSVIHVDFVWKAEAPDHFKVAVKTPIYRCALTGAGWALAGTPAPQLE